jgi:hypothetical protein
MLGLEAVFNRSLVRQPILTFPTRMEPVWLIVEGRSDAQLYATLGLSEFRNPWAHAITSNYVVFAGTHYKHIRASIPEHSSQLERAPSARDFQFLTGLNQLNTAWRDCV